MAKRRQGRNNGFAAPIAGITPTSGIAPTLRITSALGLVLAIGLVAALGLAPAMALAEDGGGNGATSLATSALAANSTRGDNVVESGTCYSGLTWEVTGEDGNLTLTISGTGAMEFIDHLSWSRYQSGISNVVIVNGVTSIGDYAFSKLESLTSVTIPDGVTSIGVNVFEDCTSLASVEIPGSVTSIGNRAFCGCSSLANITIASTSNLASIGDYAFSRCESLTSVTIPDGVTSIGDRAFEDCTSLASFEIPGSVTSIGDSAFEDCTSLASFEIPGSVTSIGDAVFKGCSGLGSISVAEGSTAYCADDGILYNQEKTTLIVCPAGRKGGVDIPTSVTSIGSYAFYGCSGLTSVGIPAGVTSIGSCAFYGCSGLESVDIPAGVTGIGSYAFYGCSGLTGVDIPASVTDIGGSAFCDCSGLSSISVAEGSTAYCTDDGILYNQDKTTLIVCPAGRKGGVDIPTSVTSIERYAFYGCSGLESVDIPAGVTNIRSYAFYGCSGLESVDIPASVTTIGNSAFRDCSSLSSITILASVKGVGFYAFDGCDRLEDIYYTGTEEQFEARLENVAAWRADVSCPEGTKIHFVAPVTVAASPEGAGSAARAYNADGSVTATATPSAGYRFLRWTKDGAAAGEGSSFSFTPLDNATPVALVAYFAKDLAIAGEIAGKTYDGLPYAPAPAVTDSLTGAAPDAADYSVAYQAKAGVDLGTGETVWADVGVGGPRDAGEYRAVVTGAAGSVYEGARAEKGFSIAPRAVTLTSQGGEKEYDGTPLTKSGVDVGGLGFVEGEVGDVKATGSVTTVADGEVVNTIVVAGGPNFKEGNYSITKNEGMLKVTPSTKELKVASADGSWTYDGDEHAKNEYSVAYDGAPCKVAVTEGAAGATATAEAALPTGDKVTITPTAAGVRDYSAGYGQNNTFTYAITRDGADASGNYSNVSASFGTLAIERREVTASAADAKAAYDGREHAGSAAVGFSGLVEGHAASITYAPARGTAMGTYEGAFGDGFQVLDAAGADVTANYELAGKTPGKLEIGKPGRTKASSVLFPGKSSAKVLWEAVAGAGSYELQWRALGGKWKTSKVAGMSKAVKRLKRGKLYQFRVRAVVGAAKGDWSRVTGRYFKRVPLKSAKRAGSGAVKAKWKADPKANAGYLVMVYDRKGGELIARKPVAAGKTSATVRGLEPGKKVFVRVRPLRSAGGATYAGVLSAGKYART